MGKDIPCSDRSCGKLGVAATCAHQLCASHCRLALTSCGFRAHDKGRQQERLARQAAERLRSQPKLQVYSHLHTRPEPIQPPDPLPSYDAAPEQVSAATLMSNPLSQMIPATTTSIVHIPTPQQPPTLPSPPERVLRVPMPTAWRDTWQRDRTRQMDKLEAERQRRENEKALLESVVIWWWGENGKEPTRCVIQGIQTYPTMKLTDFPHVVTLLNITGGDAVQVYDLRSRYWQYQQSTDSFNARRNRVLLLRRPGISVCPSIDSCILEAECGVESP
ncbi:hypothetical protein C8Q70DRAFT_407355 [Cubamyces menziesii]|nr:hypothetical protein C8Q70DRAFT_407355 [Cubamyces menziesii]